MKKINVTSTRLAAQTRQVNHVTSSEIEHSQQALDKALRESFPASDPVAVTIAKPVVLAKPKPPSQQ